MFSQSVTLQKLSLLALTTFLLVSCNKDETSTVPDDDSSQTENTTALDDTARLAAKKLYEDYYLASKSNGSDIEWTGSESSCNPGSVPQSTRDKILTRLAYFRKAAGLNNDILEDSNKSLKAQKAALIMHANDQLDHFPSESWKCYTTDGKDAAGNSLLTFSTNGEAIDSYIRDHGSNNGPVGHRRWLLWPRLQEIGIGNTSVSNALWVLGNPGTSPSDAPEFIAWPPKGYIPVEFAYPRWSFSIKDADFTTTQVSMKDSKGNTIELQLETLDNAYGDRTIVWVPSINTNSLTEDTIFNVTIQNVDVGGEKQNFEYAVILFDPKD